MKGDPMSELTMTTGTWIVDPAKEAAFVEAWAEFARWASAMPGATTLRLGRDIDDSRRFVSFAAWATPESARSWKTSVEFREQIAHVLQHVDDFYNEELAVVVAAADGNAEVELTADRTE
jgi:heme-degrading monooxygenase HmoA